MIRLHRSAPSTLLAVLVLACAASAPGGALAQNGGYQPAVPPTDPNELSGNRGIDRRLDRDEQTLRDLRQIVLQAKASGQPVQVVDAGANPVVGDLQSKIDDLTMTLSRLNGQVETLSHNLDTARKAAADANEANTVLNARIDKLQAGLLAAQTAPPPVAVSGGGQNGVLGQLPASAAGGSADQASAPSRGDEASAYRQARQVLDTGDYTGGTTALQDYLDRYPTSPRAPEANYWLGRTLSVRNMQQDAAAAYARSLKGWPQTAWAGDAVVRLGASLIELKRGGDACRALKEFDSRYAAKAATAVKTRAKDVRSQAACG